ncbi:MAG TPA: amino acid permease [Chitinophagaceae bacterium]|nr:amino acid permease [Chitinophagaceae bacterium]
MKERSRLGVFDLTMIVVSLVIGMGIFKTPVDVAQRAISPPVYFGAWILGGFVALCGALSYAEIGSRYPVTGGYYKIFSYCYHPSLAFMINCLILISNAASTSAVALIGAEYISQVLFPGSLHEGLIRQAIAIGSIILFFLVNLMGLRLSSKTQNVLTVVKISMILLLILAIFEPGQAHAVTATAGASPGLGGYFRSLGICLIAVSFSYGGYQQTINLGGEVKNPKKVIPRSIFFGIAIIILLYLAINFAYFRVIGFGSLKNAQSIASILATRVLGAAGGKIFSVLLFLSVLGYVNVQLISNPAVIFAMGEERILPGLFTFRSQKRDALVPALICFTAICIITLIFTGKFETILNWVIFMDSIGMATSVATIFILRKKTADLDPNSIYIMKLYPLLPVIFILAYMFVAGSIIVNFPQASLYGFLIFCGLFPVYLLTRFLRNRIPKT